MEKQVGGGSTVLSKVLGLVMLLCSLTLVTFARDTDSTQTDSLITNTLKAPESTGGIDHLSGAVTVTNNGISLLPTFALGKPAAIFDMAVGGKRLSFEPQLRFSLEGKPWSFLFWWRYKVLNTGKFQLNMGAHPALAFRTVPAINETSGEMLVSKRFLAGEVSPNYSLTKNTSVGLYYLHSHGFDPGVTRSTHFLALRSSFSNIRLSDQFTLRATPQLYYLRLDNKDGLYVTSTFTLAKKGFPLTLQSIVNKSIQTNIQAKRDFVWNVSLIYSFAARYRRI